MGLSTVSIRGVAPEAFSLFGQSRRYGEPRIDFASLRNERAPRVDSVNLNPARARDLSGQSALNSIRDRAANNTLLGVPREEEKPKPKILTPNSEATKSIGVFDNQRNSKIVPNSAIASAANLFQAAFEAINTSTNRSTEPLSNDISTKRADSTVLAAAAAVDRIMNILGSTGIARTEDATTRFADPEIGSDRIPVPKEETEFDIELGSAKLLEQEEFLPNTLNGLIDRAFRAVEFGPPGRRSEELKAVVKDFENLRNDLRSIASSLIVGSGDPQLESGSNQAEFRDAVKRIRDFVGTGSGTSRGLASLATDDRDAGKFDITVLGDPDGTRRTGRAGARKAIEELSDLVKAAADALDGDRQRAVRRSNNLAIESPREFGPIVKFPPGNILSFPAGAIFNLTI